MSTTTHTVPQVRFPGQAAAAEGPLDMSITYLVHHALRRDLADFARAVPATPVADRGAWQALDARWHRFTVPLRQHHHEEDDYVWPALAARVDRAGRETLAAMEAQHAELDRHLEACTAGFARLRGHADADARAALAVRLVAAREGLTRHLDDEETEAVPLMQAQLTAEEWAAMRKRFMRDFPFPALVRTIPWTMHRLPAELRAVILQHAPAAQRVILRLTERRFRRLDGRAFAHLR